MTNYHQMYTRISSAIDVDAASNSRMVKRKSVTTSNAVATSDDVATNTTITTSNDVRANDSFASSDDVPTKDVVADSIYDTSSGSVKASNAIETAVVCCCTDMHRFSAGFEGRIGFMWWLKGSIY